MLNGPILPTMLKLALPPVVVLVVLTFVGVAETYFQLATDPLAGSRFGRIAAATLRFGGRDRDLVRSVAPVGLSRKQEPSDALG